MPIHPLLGTGKLWIKIPPIMISTLLLLLNGSVHINAQSGSVSGSGNGGSISAGSGLSGPIQCMVPGACNLGTNGGSVIGSGNGGSIGAPSSNSPPLVSNSWKTEDYHGIEMQYPNDWNDNGSNGFPNDLFISSFSPYNDSRTTVEIYKDLAPDNLSAYLNQIIYNNDSYIDYNDSNNNKDTNATIIGQGYNGTLAGQDAYEVEFTYQYNGTVYQDMMVGIVTSGEVYYIDFDTPLTSFAVYLPVVLRMLDSFQVTG